MTEIFSKYWDHLHRPLAQVKLPTGIEIVPKLFQHSLCSFLLFAFIMVWIPIISSRLYPKWYDAMTDRKKGEYPSYLSSMLHHLIVVPLGWLYIYKDTLVTDYNQPVDYSWLLPIIAPFITGQMLADTIFFAIPLAIKRGNWEYILHHALGLWMISVFLTGPGNLTRFYPHLIICETTNILFNTAWLLRLAGYKDSLLVSVLEISFSVFFVLIRIINLTIVFKIIFMSDEGQTFGVGKYVFPLISLLQFYWMIKIAQSLYSKFIGGGGSGSGGEGVKAGGKKVD